MNFLALTLLATGSSALSLTKDLKAASPFVNLGCQCGSLTFVDSRGQVSASHPFISCHLLTAFVWSFLSISFLSLFIKVLANIPVKLFVLKVQGNCRSVDSTGARWCYVDHLPSSCQVQHSHLAFANHWKTLSPPHRLPKNMDFEL